VTGTSYQVQALENLRHAIPITKRIINSSITYRRSLLRITHIFCYPTASSQQSCPRTLQTSIVDVGGLSMKVLPCYEIANNPLNMQPPPRRMITLRITIAAPPLVGVGAGVIPEQQSVWYMARASWHVPLTEALNSTCMHDDHDKDDAVVT
jgi:hypothetical protein